MLVLIINHYLENYMRKISMKHLFGKNRIWRKHDSMCSFRFSIDILNIKCEENLIYFTDIAE